MNITTKDSIEKFREGDRIVRTYTKHRSSSSVDYPFTTFSSIFHKEPFGIDYLDRLAVHMRRAFISGFNPRGKGCSDSDEIYMLDFKQVQNELILYAMKSKYEGKGNKMHDVAQEYFMINDPCTICIELPLHGEDRQGFADIIRVTEDGIIQICDFKPNASSEKPRKVLTQLFHYKKMMCELCQIPPFLVECLYFDGYNCYKLI
jgi:hypothetical protein